MTVTCFHMFSNATLAWAVHFNPCVRSWRFDLASLYAAPGAPAGRPGAEAAARGCGRWLPPRSFVLSVLSVSVISGLDIALTNTSFIYLPASLVEVIKPSNVLFVLLFGLLLGLRRLSRLVVCSVAMIVGGQVLITSHAARFDWKGFEIVLAAVVMSAMKVTLLEVLLHGGASGSLLQLPRKLNAVETMAFTMPGAGVILAGAIFIPYKSHGRLCADYPRWCIGGATADSYVSEFELLFGSNEVNDAFRDGHDAVWGRVVAFVLMGACMAFLLNVSELAVVACTDSLTTSLLGVLKLILLFVATNLLLGETMSFWQILGVAIVLVGMIVYRSTLAAGAQEQQRLQEEAEMDSEAKSSGAKAMRGAQSGGPHRGAAPSSSSSKHSASLFTLEEYDDEDGANGIELVGLIKDQSQSSRKR